jgi:hypothetical protein
MTATRTTETLITPPPARLPWGVLAAAGLTVFAAVALTPWLLTPSSQIEPSPITPNWAAATPLQPASAVRQASAPSYAPTSTLGSVCPVLSDESWTVRFVGAHTARHRVRLVLPEQPCPMRSGETN